MTWIIYHYSVSDWVLLAFLVVRLLIIWVSSYAFTIGTLRSHLLFRLEINNISCLCSKLIDIYMLIFVNFVGQSTFVGSICQERIWK